MVKRKLEELSDNLDLHLLPPCKLPNVGNVQQMVPTTDSSFEVIEAELRKVMDDFVKVYERLDLSDDVTCKPNYSYTELIYLALLRSPNFCLPITEIYNYIKSRFSFFRQASSKSHWKNAVRHSLSKTKCFTKINVGRGNKYASGSNRALFLWCVLPSSIVSFARGDYRPSVDKESGTNTLRWGYYRVNAGQFWGQVSKYLQAKFDHFQYTIAKSKNPQAIVSEQKCNVPDDILRDLESQPAPTIPQNTENLAPSITPEPRLSPSLASLDLQEFSYSPNASADSGVATADESSPLNRQVFSSNDSGFADTKLLLSRLPRPETINASFISSSGSPTYDFNRDSPDLPDLGHVSSFELSPLAKYCDSPVADLRLSPLQSNELAFQVSSGTRLSPPVFYHGTDMTSTPYHYQHYQHHQPRSTPQAFLHQPPLPYNLQPKLETKQECVDRNRESGGLSQFSMKPSGHGQQEPTFFPYHRQAHWPYPIQGHDVMLQGACTWN